MKTIAVLFAEGFEEIEAITIVDVLRRAEHRVHIVGVTGKSVTGAHGVVVQADCLLSAVKAETLDMVVLPGGLPGATNLRDHAGVLALCQAVEARQCQVAALCAAPIALQAAGLLKGKTITCYPAFSNQVPDAKYTGAAVEVDGRLITGAGPGAALEFSLALVRALGDPAKAAALRQGMLVRP